MEEWVREKTKKGSLGSWLNSKKGQYVLIILISIGILALIWPGHDSSGRSGNARQPTGQEPLPSSGYSGFGTAQEVEAILQEIEGAGQVKVSITLASTGEKTFAANTRNESRESSENDRQGGKKESIEHSVSEDVAVSSGSPLIVEEKNPEILGVLVVAEGARYSEVKAELINATATLLNVPVHKVQVMPKGGN